MLPANSSVASRFELFAVRGVSAPHGCLKSSPFRHSMEMRRTDGCGQLPPHTRNAPEQRRHAILFQAYFLTDFTLSATSICKAFSTIRGILSASHCRSIGRNRSAVESSIGAADTISG